MTPPLHDLHWGNIFGRLKPGVTIAQAQAELSVINARLSAKRGAELPANAWSISVEPLKNDWLSKGLERNLWLLLAAVGFVLLIGYDSFPFNIAGRPVSDANRPIADYELVTPGYFDTFHVRLIRGRFLNDDDNAGSPQVVVVSESCKALSGRCRPAEPAPAASANCSVWKAECSERAADCGRLPGRAEWRAFDRQAAAGNLRTVLAESVAEYYVGSANGNGSEADSGKHAQGRGSSGAHRVADTPGNNG